MPGAFCSTRTSGTVAAATFQRYPATVKLQAAHKVAETPWLKLRGSANA